MSDVSDISVSEEEIPSKKRKLNKEKGKVIKTKNKKKKKRLNNLIESEAEEASDEENSENDYDYNKPEIKDTEYDRRIKEALEKKSRKNVLANLEEKYKDLSEGEAMEYMEADGLESNEEDVEPPGLKDPKIWRVGCKRGKE